LTFFWRPQPDSNRRRRLEALGAADDSRDADGLSVYSFAQAQERARAWCQGHSDTRMVEKHYGHLSSGYVADTVRAAFGTLGLIEPSNVVPIAVSR
jgi:hypothetical protein